MSDGRRQAAFCATLVDEWMRAGLTDVVVAPGSRSTPLALACAAAADHPAVSEPIDPGAPIGPAGASGTDDGRRLRVHLRLDERSAGFFALGLARATGRPVAVVVTSGTAAAELHPAVAEADLGQVPLLVCTSDRPPELQGVGAPQTMDQRGLFAGLVREWVDPGPAEGMPEAAWRSFAARLYDAAAAHPLGPGPVQVNLPFRDPLVAEPDRIPPGRPGGARWHRLAVGRRFPDPALLSELASVARGFLLLGAGAGAPDAWEAAARALGWVVAADPRSGARQPGTVGPLEVLVEVAGPDGRCVPDLVVQVGESWASGAVARWLRGLGERVVVVASDGRWVDPGRRAGLVLRADPDLVAAGLREARVTGSRSEDGSAVPGRPAPWAHLWADLEEAAEAALREALAATSTSELAAVSAVWESLGPEDDLLVASSNAIRHLELVARPRLLPPRVFANRGVNGIDGLVSTALGIAAAGCGRRVVAIVGDLAFLHDVGALVRLVVPEIGGRPLCPPVDLVVLDNGGGAIFASLPQATLVPPERFGPLFLTPPAVDVGTVAAGFGVEVRDVSTPEALTTGLAARADATRAGVPPVVLWRWRQPAAAAVATVGRVRQVVADAIVARLQRLSGSSPGGSHTVSR
jgi:2-succinyl-5-enolpyruvyl-6-hydroxy-3-cyclohexene-1-carboxylate synthase